MTQRNAALAEQGTAASMSLHQQALIIMSRRAAYPRALMVPYRKGER